MGQFQVPLPDLVVANGQTTSNVLKSEDRDPVSGIASGSGYRDGDSITIIAPAVLPEVANIKVAELESGGTFGTLQRPAGTDIVIAAGKAITVDSLSFKALEIVLGGAAAAQRTFKVTKAVWV